MCGNNNNCGICNCGGWGNYGNGCGNGCGNNWGCDNNNCGCC